MTKPIPEFPDTDRFWSKVAKGNCTDCWLWTACCTDDGYGHFSINYSTYKASRVAYALTWGDPGESQVLHKCDIPPCCNPRHLTIGTHEDNMRHKIRRGRQPCGSQVGTAKLTEQEVRAILISKDTNTALAAEYNVDASTISDIKTGKSWKHVPGPRREAEVAMRRGRAA
jgi:hypothetical protein